MTGGTSVGRGDQARTGQGMTRGGGTRCRERGLG